MDNHFKPGNRVIYTGNARKQGWFYNPDLIGKTATVLAVLADTIRVEFDKKYRNKSFDYAYPTGYNFFQLNFDLIKLEENKYELKSVVIHNGEIK